MVPEQEARGSIMYCHELSHGYDHFFQHPKAVGMCGGGPVLRVRVVEATDTGDTYWGWWESSKGAFLFVYPKRFLVEMCFPYGCRVEVDRGRGFLLPVSVVLV